MGLDAAGTVVVVVTDGVAAVPVEAGLENEKPVEAVGCDVVAVVTVVLAPNTDVVEPGPNRLPVDGTFAAVENPPKANFAAGALVVAGAVVEEAGVVAPKLKVAADGWAAAVVPNVNVLEAAAVLAAAGVAVDEALEDVPKAAIQAMNS